MCLDIKKIPRKTINEIDDSTTYTRGCMLSASIVEVEDGCFGGSNVGIACYKKCTGDLCNDHKNLNSATSATVGLLGALMYSML